MTRFACPHCGSGLRRTRGRPREIQCPRCRFLLFDYPRPCAGMVVVKEDTVLLLRRGHSPRRGFLDVPGGFVEAGEPIEAAARRELREETGLTIGRVLPLGFYWDRYFIRGFGFFPTMNFYFIGRWRSGEPLAGDDAARAEWVPVARLGRLGAAPAWKHMATLFRDVKKRMSRGARVVRRRGGSMWVSPPGSPRR